MTEASLQKRLEKFKSDFAALSEPEQMQIRGTVWLVEIMPEETSVRDNSTFLPNIDWPAVCELPTEERWKFLKTE